MARKAYMLISTKLAIGAMSLDVVHHFTRQKVGAGVALAEAFAELGGRDVFGDAGEEVNAGALGGGEVEGGEIGFSEGVAGAGDYDPFGEFEEAVG